MKNFFVLVFASAAFMSAAQASTIVCRDPANRARSLQISLDVAALEKAGAGKLVRAAATVTGRPEGSSSRISLVDVPAYKASVRCFDCNVYAIDAVSARRFGSLEVTSERGLVTAIVTDQKGYFEFQAGEKLTCRTTGRN